MGWVKMEHKEQPKVRYWVKVDEHKNPSSYEIKNTKLAFYDEEERPPEQCLPGGTLPAKKVWDLYRQVHD